MFRQWAIAGGLVCGGAVFAQPWPAVPTDKPATEAVYVMRTAGQTDRQVKVVRAADPADPASMAEVRDTATGQTFVIPGKVLAKLPKAGSTQPVPPASAEPAPPPVTLLPNTGTGVAPSPVVALPSAPKMPNPLTLEPPLPARAPNVDTVPPPAEPARVITPASAELPTVASPMPPALSQQTFVPSPVTPAAPSTPRQSPDPWRAIGEAKVIAPTPLPAAAGPRLTPVPSWRAAPTATPPGLADPWRPTGG